MVDDGTVEVDAGDEVETAGVDAGDEVETACGAGDAEDALEGVTTAGGVGIAGVGVFVTGAGDLIASIDGLVIAGGFDAGTVVVVEEV